MHFGKITFDVDERGEVGLLTRNIKLQCIGRRGTVLLRQGTSWRWSEAGCLSMASNSIEWART